MQGVYLYVNNLQEFGHLTDLEGFDTSKTNPNVYELMRNRKDWEHAYLHSEYMGNFSPNRTHLQVKFNEIMQFDIFLLFVTFYYSDLFIFFFKKELFMLRLTI